MSFTKLGLAPELLRSIEAGGYTQPTPIQIGAIPIVLAKKDLLAGAQTGTGKTAAFALPVLHILSRKSKQVGHSVKVPSALVLTPTRELAAQVCNSFVSYGKHLPLRAVPIFGGVNINPQIKQFRKGVDIVVATPGRLLDHVNQGTVNLQHVEILILDEADRMLDMGFIRDIRKIMSRLPKKRQNLLFSATYTDEVRKLADNILNKPSVVEVARRNTAAEGVTHKVYYCDKTAKRELLADLIEEGQWHQVLVFARTKHGADRLAKQLRGFGIEADAIHGNKSQGARTRTLGAFKNGDLRVLVATDIAARGIDIENLPYVLNYELPNVTEDYVHRIGRTGRAGEEGVAISLVAPEERKFLKAIEKLLQKSLEVQKTPAHYNRGLVIPEKEKKSTLRSRRGHHKTPELTGTRRPSNSDSASKNRYRSGLNKAEKR
jgi:ATP-dependent RNA helicase RhlE